MPSISPDAAPWIGLIGAVVALLAVDLRVMSGRGGVMTPGFAAKASLLWVAIALAFGGLILLTSEPGRAGDYLAGYLVEKSLSLDNVFVFLLVLGAFAIPDDERHRLLSWAIAGALVLRLIFILIGAAALSAFSWLNLVFAAILVWTGYRLWRHRHDHAGEERLVAVIRKRLPIADRDDLPG